MPAEQVLRAGARPTRTLTAGAGMPIVWLHDTLGNRWTTAHSLLSEAFRVIAPSLPGVEDSTTLHGIDGPQDVVFWLLDVFAELGLERPALVGCGLGGWMAAEFAVRDPERLGRLVLVDAYGLQVAGALAADEFALTPAMLRPLLFASPDGGLAAEMLPDTFAPDQVEVALHARVAAARLAWQFPYDRKLRGRLGRATLPALVIWGAADRLVPPAHGRAYAEGLPDAHLVVIPGAGHYPYAEQPEAFTEAVTGFLQM